MKNTVKLEEGITSATRSRTYMLPLLVKELDIEVRPNMINCFLFHKDYPELKNHLFILFRFTADRLHLKKEEALINHKLCVFHKDLSKEHYMICFEIPESIKGEHQKLLDSKYSTLTKESQKQILGYWQLNDNHAVARVLRKDPLLKKSLEESLNVKIDSQSELSSILDLSKETYDPSWLVLSESPLPKMSVYK